MVELTFKETIWIIITADSILVLEDICVDEGLL